MYHQRAVIADIAASRGVTNIKQAALLFDSVAVLQTQEAKIDKITKAQPFPSVSYKEGEWLANQGIIVFLPDYSEELCTSEDKTLDRYTAYRRLSGANVFLLPDDVPAYEPMIRSAANFITRYSASRINGDEADERVVPLLDDARYQLTAIDFPYSNEPKVDYTQSTALILAQLPAPDDLTPWENILEFRNENENALAFFALRDWITQIARAGVSNLELRDKMEYELARLTKSLERAKIKYNYETTETIVTSAVSIIENLVKFKWTEVVKSAFSVRHHHLDMLEAEAKIAEHGLYYIVKARETFGTKPSVANN